MKHCMLWIWLILMLAGTTQLSACGYVAAGAAGAVIGHEAAERRNRDDEDEEEDE